MKTFTYNSNNLSIKERLTISSLLSLFESRLNAKWVSVSHGQSQTSHIVFADADQPEGRQILEASSSGETLLAVTADDRWPRPPFVARPIHAYGPNGVVVLFNSIGQALLSPSADARPDPRPEPARIRMTGRVEAPAPPPPAVRPQTAAPSPKPASKSIPPPNPSRAVAEPPTPARVAVRWGPPEPIYLPPLTHMPGARIHWFGRAAERRRNFDLPQASSSASNAAPAASDSPVPTSGSVSNGLWRPPDPETRSPLVEMPIAHRPLELHRPPVPVIGRARIEVRPPATPVVESAPETPTLRTSPPQWRAPEPVATPEAAPETNEVRSSEELVIESAVSPVLAEPNPEPVVLEASAADTAQVTPAEVASHLDAIENAPEEAVAAPLADPANDLANLADAMAFGTRAEHGAEKDIEADWWGTAQLEFDAIGDSHTEPAEGSLLSALKAIKASNKPGILEIAGLPAVCVIPERNVYFTTAPAARLETAVGAGAEVTWRPSSSEAEARRISGTEQSRQASLEQLCWTASLLSSPADIDAMAGRQVRLRRWPPLTESRGRSKFVRYATLLSGAQASPLELAEITGDPLEDIVCFVHACAEMNLLETSGQSKAPSAVPAVRTQGVGILRGMIEQLTPPNL